MAGRAQDFSSLQVWWDHAPSLPPQSVEAGPPLAPCGSASVLRGSWDEGHGAMGAAMGLGVRVCQCACARAPGARVAASRVGVRREHWGAPSSYPNLQVRPLNLQAVIAKSYFTQTGSKSVWASRETAWKEEGISLDRVFFELRSTFPLKACVFAHMRVYAYILPSIRQKYPRIIYSNTLLALCCICDIWGQK